jgi:hypothetical protein
VILTTELVEGDEVQAIVECVKRTQSDLLVLGVYRHSLLFSRLWNHTAHDLSQQVMISILGGSLKSLRKDRDFPHFRRVRGGQTISWNL